MLPYYPADLRFCKAFFRYWATAKCLTATGVWANRFLQNNRDFDPYDVLANVVGSLAALGLCQWYHRRMLERKRASKTYAAIPGDEETGGGALDVELEEGVGPQETGVTSAGVRETNIDKELDNWDENVADDWDEEEPKHANGIANSKDGVSSPPTGMVEMDTTTTKKRDD